VLLTGEEHEKKKRELVNPWQSRRIQRERKGTGWDYLAEPGGSNISTLERKNKEEEYLTQKEGGGKRYASHKSYLKG